MLLSAIASSVLPLALAAPAPLTPSAETRDLHGRPVCSSRMGWTPFHVVWHSGDYGRGTSNSDLKVIPGVPFVLNCQFDHEKARHWTHSETRGIWNGPEGLKAARDNACWWAVSNGKIDWDTAGRCWEGVHLILPVGGVPRSDFN